MKNTGTCLQISFFLLRFCTFFLTILSVNNIFAQTMDQFADRAAIAEQIARYSYAVDSRDLDTLTGLFTEDCLFELYQPGQAEPARVETREGIRNFSVEMNKQSPGVKTGHHQSGLLFMELTANSAKTRVMILVTRQGADDASPQTVVSGVYYDDWRKTKNGWLIKTRTLRMEALPL